MQKSKERTCLMCGTKYQWCIHCKDTRPDEGWRFLYHDEKCRDMSEIWYAYRGKEISKAEAKEKMSALKPNIDDVLKYTSIAAKEIREIFDVPEEQEVVENEITNHEESNDVVEDAEVAKEDNFAQHTVKHFDNKHDYRKKK